MTGERRTKAQMEAQRKAQRIHNLQKHAERLKVIDTALRHMRIQLTILSKMHAHESNAMLAQYRKETGKIYPDAWLEETQLTEVN